MDCQSVLDGGRAIKAEGDRFLPQPEGMSDDAYQSYVQRALFYGATGRTVEALTGAVFRREPTVEIQKSFEDELKDVTLSGVSFQAIAQDIFSRVLGVGRHGVLIDWSDTNKRPYWTRYDATSITNWQTQRIGGKQVLTQVILHEIATTPSGDPFRPNQTEQYRQLRLDTRLDTPAADVVYEYHNTVWQPRITKDETGREQVEWVITSDTVPERRGKPIPFIPFTFFGPGGIDPMPLRPPLIDLVEVNLAHYRVSADHKHALFLTAQPTPWVTGAKEGDAEDLKIGSSTAWVFESENAKVGMLEFTGAGVEAMQVDLQDMQRQMSVLGARLLEVPPSHQEAAAAVRMRHAGDDAVLQKIAMSVGGGAVASAPAARVVVGHWRVRRDDHRVAQPGVLRGADGRAGIAGAAADGPSGADELCDVLPTAATRWDRTAWCHRGRREARDRSRRWSGDRRRGGTSDVLGDSRRGDGGVRPICDLLFRVLESDT